MLAWDWMEIISMVSMVSIVISVCTICIATDLTLLTNRTIYTNFLYFTRENIFNYIYPTEYNKVRFNMRSSL